ncbi:MAG: hypothetical protein Q9208_007764 [Pyrenodesmia sp. 3 TL-2023]
MDAAPDIYETPELTDDASTAVVGYKYCTKGYGINLFQGSSTIRSDSRASSAAEESKESPAINRQRIDPNEARNSFLTSAGDGNLSTSRSWIGSKRAGYKISGTRIVNGTFQDGLTQSSDDEDEESLERKLARLRREVAETKDAFAKRTERVKPKVVAAANDGPEPFEVLGSLDHVLDSIEQPGALKGDASSPRLVNKLNATYQSGEARASAKAAEELDHATDASNAALGNDDAHALSRISDFDKRLRLLETALGMDLVPLPTQDRGASRAVLPILDRLDRRISTMSITDTSLDKISRQIRQMTQDSEKLAEARKAAAMYRPSDRPMGERSRQASSKAVDRATEDQVNLDQVSKINALYGTLPTIESLSPLLPSVLDRLQSLRAIHADAALASEALFKVESRQASMTEELNEWKDGLQKVESAMQAGEQSLKENVGVVDEWVKELEKRLQISQPVNGP